MEQLRQQELLDLHIRSNSLSHAYLFTGPRFSGKMNTAQRVVSSTLCKNKPAGILASCGKCRECVMIVAGTHPDVLVSDIESTGESMLRLDYVKGWRSRVSKHPHGQFHIFIARDVARMTREAANALLKILEEPKSKSVFILLAENTDDVPDTICSRSWQIRFWPSLSLLMDKLIEDKTEQEQIKTIMFGTAADKLRQADQFREYPDRMRLWYTKVQIILANMLHNNLVKPEEDTDVYSLARKCHTMLKGEAHFLKPYATKRILFDTHLLLQ